MNSRHTIGFQYASALLLGFLLLFLSGCATHQGPPPPSTSYQETAGGQLSCFLNLKMLEGQSMKMVIHSIELRGENDSWTPLPLPDPIEADSQFIMTGQMFLGRFPLASGYYNRLRIKTAQNTQSIKEGKKPTTIELEIRTPLYVAEGDSHSLFLTWDLMETLNAEDPDKPVLSLLPKVKKLLVDIAYVACPEINTVYMICTDKNWVCDSLGVKGSPSYLISDPLAPTANLFALTENDMDIKRIGPASNRVETTYNLSRLGKGLHFTISPDSLWAYVIDRKRGNILRINLHSGSIEARKRLRYEPSYILYLEKQGVLAVTLSRSQTVVLLDPETLAQVHAISTGSKPEGLMLFKENLLYIAEAGGNSVMVYDLIRNKIQKRIPVDISPRRLLAINGNIYVTNHDSRSISILKPGQLGVSRAIPLDGPPLELAYSPGNKWLYIGNELTKSLDIINPVSNKWVGRIPLGAIPKGIAVLD
jgi:DNA-binding beta-propeller fold protein YncE